MSLVPYLPAESRQVVLRHGSAVVVYDEDSKQLVLRDDPSLRDASSNDPASSSAAVQLADCPYCHRPLRSRNGHHAAGANGAAAANSHRGLSPRRDGSVSDHAQSQDDGTGGGFVVPMYWRMLHHSTPGMSEDEVDAARAAEDETAVVDDEGTSPAPPSSVPPVPSEAELVGSEPVSPPQPHGIQPSAFSPKYFERFFVEEKELGRGGKGVVLLVRHVLDGVFLGHFACKRVPVGDDHEWLEKVLQEVQLLQGLSHQNLVSYRHVWLEDYKPTAFGPTVPCAFILQQYCNAGDLLHYVLNPSNQVSSTQALKERLRRRSRGQPEPPTALHEPRRMNFEEIFSFFKDITSGLHHLHTNGYIHRDLKPSNCLLHRTGSKIRVLVSDFGEVQATNMTRKSSGTTGTISYCAPEVLRRDSSGAYGNFSLKSDIFSLGMIVYFMCFGCLPYVNSDSLNEENENVDVLRAEITAWAGFQKTERARTDLPEQLYKFLKRLLSLNPAERPATDEILQGIRADPDSDAATASFAPNPNSSIFADIKRRISPADTPDGSPAPSPPVSQPGSMRRKPPGFQLEPRTRFGPSSPPVSATAPGMRSSGLARHPPRSISPTHKAASSAEETDEDDLHGGSSSPTSPGGGVVMRNRARGFLGAGTCLNSTAAGTTSTAAGGRGAALARQDQAYDDASGSVVLRRRNVSRSFSAGPTPPPSGAAHHHHHAHRGSSPLMLPPPRPFARRSRLARWTMVAAARALRAGTALAALRVALFALKLYALLRPCAPFLPRGAVAYPLVVVASLDLVGGVGAALDALLGGGVWEARERGWEWEVLGSAVLVGVHFGVLAMVRRGRGLCEGHGGWEVEVDAEGSMEL
ncbi:kinase-like domain-containing protein [Lineolata rhizophorae]|uniref:non-specific serine/threonine protein kinase n=1 Tax=Lineolata rhizophorae TaxID=578093 RepID=A0A6A6NR84_9PEZI|nr:kinase-like domain-containing protein [Lineolata rhizophorae]